MVENYTKDLKESVYHSAVVSALAIGYTIQYSIVPPKDERCHHGVKLNHCRTNSANSLLDCVRHFAWSADTPSRSVAFNQGSL